MKLSTKGRYGLRALVDLAVHSGGEHLSLCSIAERQHISENYLEQVFSTLRKTGIVKSVKGAQGGYRFADNAAKVSVGDVLRALEGDLSIGGEAENGQDTAESGIQHCINRMVWNKMNTSINQIADSTTIEDLADAYRGLHDPSKMMYYI